MVNRAVHYTYIILYTNIYARARSKGKKQYDL